MWTMNICSQISIHYMVKYSRQRMQFILFQHNSWNFFNQLTEKTLNEVQKKLITFYKISECWDIQAVDQYTREKCVLGWWSSILFYFLSSKYHKMSCAPRKKKRATNFRLQIEHKKKRAGIGCVFFFLGLNHVLTHMWQSIMTHLAIQWSAK